MPLKSFELFRGIFMGNIFASLPGIQLLILYGLSSFIEPGKQVIEQPGFYPSLFLLEL
jgi:hypothetical protein